MIVVGERSYFGIKGKVCLGGIPEQRAVSHQKSFRGAGERGPQKTGEECENGGDEARVHFNRFECYHCLALKNYSDKMNLTK